MRVKYSESSEPGITTCVLINTSFIAYFSVPNMQYELTADLILRKPINWQGREVYTSTEVQACMTLPLASTDDGRALSVPLPRCLPLREGVTNLIDQVPGHTN